MSNRGDLTGGLEIVEINGKKYLEIVFFCNGCNYPIIRESYDHNNCKCDNNQVWYCENCDFSDEEDDEENDKENDEEKIDDVSN